MKKSGILTFSILALLSGCSESTQSIQYPETKTVEQVDVYHGMEVADPYRWLEDTDSPETRQWIEAQNQVTSAYLASIPVRDRIRSRLTELWNYEKFGIPNREGDSYFFSRNDGLQNQSVIFRVESLAGQPVEVLDPNTLSEDGTVALTSYRVSPDGTLMAYGLSSGGSDWQEWKVREIETGADLSDHLKWIKFSSVSWSPDGKSFYYSRYDAPREDEELAEVNYYHKLYRHQVGTSQEEDELIYHRVDQKEWGFNGTVTDDGRFLIIRVSHGTDVRNGIFLKRLDRKNSEVVELLNQFDAGYDFVGNEGEVLLFQTNLDAPRGKLISIDLRRPSRDQWKVILPESDSTLDSVTILNHQLVASYLKDARSQVKIFDLEGNLIRQLELPGIGRANGFTGKSDHQETFYAFTTFTAPTTIYHYNLDNGEASVFRQPEVAFDPAQYESKQVFYTSKDGTRVPMFVTYKKGLNLDGSNPTLLYGYGGFNISLTPSFSVSNLVWMEMGGVYALANLRGGGEYGEEWHEAGMKENKQNVFDDFIAAAEWLIENGYTSREKLAIEGGSNGGLLVGASIIQRPELFGAAIPHVGVMDMLRFHKFTIGWAWVSDYGSPDDPEDFQTLHSYSPYHNLKPGTSYPATLITTADHDDRVVPGHSFKFAAALQKAQAGADPVLIRIETRAGHGAGKPTTKRIEEAADVLSFLYRELGMSGLET